MPICFCLGSVVFLSQRIRYLPKEGRGLPEPRQRGDSGEELTGKLQTEVCAEIKLLHCVNAEDRLAEGKNTLNVSPLPCLCINLKVLRL